MDFFPLKSSSSSYDCVCVSSPKCSVMGFHNKIVTRFAPKHSNQWKASKKRLKYMPLLIIALVQSLGIFSYGKEL